MKSFSDLFLNIWVRKGQSRNIFFQITFSLFHIEQFIVANQSVITASVASLVTCNDILQASAGVCLVPDEAWWCLMLVRWLGPRHMSVQCCVLTFADKKSYEQKHSTFLAAKTQLNKS